MSVGETISGRIRPVRETMSGFRIPIASRHATESQFLDYYIYMTLKRVHGP